MHIFLDEGGGIFPSTDLDDEQIRSLAANIEKAYPPASLAEQSQDLNPVNWANEGKK